ncbi:MAG: selenocysteine-specific translation elongation factor [Armatimonadota bacterium]|nr:selenocysteine-specific translation elongation factor [Armatimonadota bacterium]MDR7450261.1 selenocysteine-specific translation elongation factor [Armatimonadota bacterium]MDR7467156.1 selenocysteine-specific translation elongation factor [Armatimonadota bacterium]MDR7493302.1 selenocysteine-specific translation elongation factor [Armatimonadota bacterium]MDR7500151.1 selenocysteine-specific translation elongation factor [Armatimonadota bacterium]
MRHYVIGTAGHIDHGKSALVKALSGIDPDRLEEEKRRGMTIDLGFAHFDLPGGRRVGIVDVPGHERLIRNMLAGATGIDLVLLVVAADEGVMPQTREHLDILRFLPVRTGIVVLNKVDLAPDRGWLDLVRADIRRLVDGTFLEGAPIVEVSARTGQGMPDLVAAIDAALETVPRRPVDAPARLPVDRAFTVAGFGTVVTGTLWSGRIAPGDSLELLPAGRVLRVRGVQSHGARVEAAEAGSRVAVNLAGIEKDDVARGDVLATPGVFTPTERLDVELRLLPGVPALAHMARVRVYLGSAEVIGRAALVDRARLDPGDGGLVQLRLERPIVADAGDPFVVRRYSPMLTIGGGRVLDAHPPLRRRGMPEAAAPGVPADLPARAEAAVRRAGAAGLTVEDLMRTVAATRAQIDETVRTLVTAGRLLDVRGRLFHPGTVDELGTAIRDAVAAYHAAEPWRAGIAKDELKRRVFGGGDDRAYALALDRLTGGGTLDDLGGLVRLRGFRPTVDPEESALRERIAAALRNGRFAPPSREELARSADPKMFERAWRALLDDGTIVDAGQGVYFHRDTVEEIKQAVADEVRTHGSVTVAALRTRLGTSRRYALTVLEYFDSIKLTRRVGDVRVLLDRSRPAGA